MTEYTYLICWCWQALGSYFHLPAKFEDSVLVVARPIQSASDLTEIRDMLRLQCPDRDAKINIVQYQLVTVVTSEPQIGYHKAQSEDDLVILGDAC